MVIIHGEGTTFCRRDIGREDTQASAALRIPPHERIIECAFLTFIYIFSCGTFFIFFISFFFLI